MAPTMVCTWITNCQLLSVCGMNHNISELEMPVKLMGFWALAAIPLARILVRSSVFTLNACLSWMKVSASSQPFDWRSYSFDPSSNIMPKTFLSFGNWCFDSVNILKLRNCRFSIGFRHDSVHQDWTVAICRLGMGSNLAFNPGRPLFKFQACPK